MSVQGSEIDDDDSSELLKAIAWTPPVAPFRGTERYRVCACLGEGGFGVVYEVEDRTDGRRLALKTLKPQRSGFAANIRRLKREFRSVADLVHPNLVALHELTSSGPRWFFTMDLVRGVSFLDHVRPGGALDEPRLRRSLVQLVDGIAALHGAGVVHRDLKPSNVLVDDDGRVVILDFGLAGDDVEPGLAVAGTPSFMSPEQLAGEPVGEAADWYSVGVMLHQALTGVLPGGAPPEAAAARHALDDLCLAMLRASAADRPSEREIKHALGQPIDRARPRERPVELVGRRAELATLHDAYAASRRGAQTVVCVHGEPGVGKTALVSRWLSELPRDTVVLAGRCHEREAVPFKALDGVIEALVAHLQTLELAELATLVPRGIAAAAQLFPILDTIAAVRGASRATTPVDPSELRTRSFRVVEELLGRVAASRPLVIVIDDLQWGDLDSARLLAELLAPARLRALVVFAYRSDDATPSSPLRATLVALATSHVTTRELEVQPLPRAEAEQLAGALVDAHAGAAIARMIAERAEGHPLFIHELASRRDPGDATLPTLNDILWDRASRLPEAARALLETIAVAGEPLPQHVSCAAAGLADGALDAVRSLRAEQLVRGGAGALDVFHGRIRDAVVTRMDAAVREQRHRGLARELARLDEPDLEAIARHHDAAGDAALAADFALRAGERAMAALAFDRAAALYRMAIDNGQDSADVYERLGDAWLAAGASAAGGHAYLEAARRCRGPRAVDLQSRGGVELCCAGDFASGRAALVSALAAVGERAPSPRMSILEATYHLVRVRTGRALGRQPRGPVDTLRLGVLERAAQGLGYGGVIPTLGLMMRSSRRAIESGDPRHVTRGLLMTTLGHIAHKRSRSAQLDALLDHATATALDLDDPPTLALAHRTRAEAHFMFGELSATQRACEAGRSVIVERCHGLGVIRRYLELLDARCALMRGDLDRARELGERLLREAQDREDALILDAVRVGVLVPLYLAQDDVAHATAIRHPAGDVRCGNSVFHAESGAALALYRGDPDEARRVWEQLQPVIAREGLYAAPAFRVFGIRSQVCALLAGTPTRRDRARARALARQLAGRSYPQAIAVYHSARANLAAARGDRDRAATHLGLAIDAFDAAEHRLDAATCRYARAQLTGVSVDEVAAQLARDGVRVPQRWVACWFPAVTGSLA